LKAIEEHRRQKKLLSASMSEDSKNT
jgi:hypothetical protein